MIENKKIKITFGNINVILNVKIVVFQIHVA